MLKTKTQIAWEYGICIKTLNKQLEKFNIELKPGLIAPSEQELIYGKLGQPERYIEQGSEIV